MRTGLGIGVALTFFALAVEVQADSLSAPSGASLALPGQTLPALLFATLLGVGAVLQIVGLYCARRRTVLLGAALVVCAGFFDRDPVLAVGQLVLLAALWPTTGKKSASRGRPKGSRQG